MKTMRFATWIMVTLLASAPALAADLAVKFSATLVNSGEQASLTISGGKPPYEVADPRVTGSVHIKPKQGLGGSIGSVSSDGPDFVITGKTPGKITIAVTDANKAVVKTEFIVTKPQVIQQPKSNLKVETSAATVKAEETINLTVKGGVPTYKVAVGKARGSVYLEPKVKVHKLGYGGSDKSTLSEDPAFIVKGKSVGPVTLLVSDGTGAVVNVDLAVVPAAADKQNANAETQEAGPKSALKIDLPSSVKDKESVGFTIKNGVAPYRVTVAKSQGEAEVKPKTGMSSYGSSRTSDKPDFLVRGMRAGVVTIVVSDATGAELRSDIRVSK